MFRKFEICRLRYSISVFKMITANIFVVQFAVSITKLNISQSFNNFVLPESEFCYQHC